LSTVSNLSQDPAPDVFVYAGPTFGTNPEGLTNLDIAVSSNGKFIYTLNSAACAIAIFAVQKDGALLDVRFASGASPLNGVNRIAAF
jgi:6-phosphogluconolactonase